MKSESKISKTIDENNFEDEIFNEFDEFIKYVIPREPDDYWNYYKYSDDDYNYYDNDNFGDSDWFT